VQQQVHSGLHYPPASYTTSGGGGGGAGAADRDQQQQSGDGGHAAAVAAVAAAASAAAAAAAAAVVAAAEAHVQASLQANPPKGFPFFGLSPSMLANMGLQLQSEAQVKIAFGCPLILVTCHRLIAYGTRAACRVQEWLKLFQLDPIPPYTC
jgi:hypothetical protein